MRDEEFLKGAKEGRIKKMQWQEVPEVKDFMRALYYQSATVNNDIDDAAEEAGNLEEFKKLVKEKMAELESEAKGISSKVEEL